MSHRVETIALPTMSPGTQRSLKVHRFGVAGARPKAYLQAGLHPDALPAVLAAHHLLSLLREADARGRIAGEIVLVPVANPICLGQTIHGGSPYDSDFAGNWPDLSEGLRNAVEQKLSADSVANVRVVRAALADRIAVMHNKDELSALQQILMGFAYDADIVLDLHCDDEPRKPNEARHEYALEYHDYQDQADNGGQCCDDGPQIDDTETERQAKENDDCQFG